ncbi:MAG: phage gp6-like head-tail connector protein [Deltaproteobacteria bacterium]|nr:phage gp6-like head-tail connector protein [Deltaproteobacteria bacterium]
MTGDFTTLANVKAWLNLTTAAADDLLARLISAASAWARTYMQREILAADYTEIRDGHGGQALFFRNYPVTAIQSVKINGLEIPAAAGALDKGYRSNGKLLYLQGYQFVRGQGNVELAYTAGYATPPPELEQAVIEMVAFRYKERDHLGQQSANFQGQNLSFTVADMPVSAKAVLDRLKRVTPV